MDTFLYCREHSDLWQAGCLRCEACCQHHYGKSVKEQFDDDGSIEQRSKNWKVFESKPGESFMDFIERTKQG